MMAMNMVVKAKDVGPRNTQTSCICYLLGVSRDFYYYQINGAMFMLVRTLDYISLEGTRPSHMKDPTVITAYTKLLGLQTFGGFVADQTYPFAASISCAMIWGDDRMIIVDSMMRFITTC